MSNGWASLLHWRPMDTLRLIISWLPVLLGEPVVLPPIRTGESNLVDPMTVLPSRGVVPPMTFRITYVGVWETHEALRAASVTISFKTIVWLACKVSPLPAASSSIVWSVGGIATGMNRLINNLRREFLLVVSISVTFLFFLSLVWLSTFGSLFGSLSTSYSYEL